MTTLRCIRCSYEPNDDELDTSVCPRCQTASTALASDNDVTISINWQELRILSMWAEFWAAKGSQPLHRKASPANDPQRLVSIICGRLQAQHPERSPLTLSGEIAQVRQEFSAVDVLNFDEDDEANEER